MNDILLTAIKHWEYVAPIVKMPRNKKEFTELTLYLDELLELVGNNEKHRLINLVDILSHFIFIYEEEFDKKIKAKGVAALRFLMEAHQLKQSDFAEIASQGVMSEILNGKRALNMRQIKQLAKRFKVSPDTFIDD